MINIKHLYNRQDDKLIFQVDNLSEGLDYNLFYDQQGNKREL